MQELQRKVPLRDFSSSNSLKFGLGIGSIKRLAKKVQKDDTFLSSCGVKEDDIEELLVNLNRLALSCLHFLV